MLIVRQEPEERLSESCRAQLSLQEVADLLGITRSAVQQCEQSALRKLSQHPLIRRLAVESGILREGEQCP